MSASHSSPDITALLREAEIEAERIVSLVRVFMGAGLLIFYLFIVEPSPQGQMSRSLGHAFLPYLSFLTYFTVGVVVFLLIELKWYHRWMMWPAAAADVLFALGGIWATMENLQMSGASTFLVPAVWMVPLVLAFGVLRGNPTVQGVTVLTLVAGLAVTIVQMTGDDFFIPYNVAWLFQSLSANLMRVIIVALTGGILVLAAYRRRRLNDRAIRYIVSTQNLTRFLPQQLAPQIALGSLDAMREGQREEMAILFTDIRDFTKTSEGMEPQEVSDLVTEFRRVVSGVVDDHGGMVDKFVGDNAMVVFSNRDDPQDAAARALSCAKAMHAALSDWAYRRKAKGQVAVQAGIGVHFGPVYAGVVGDDIRLEFSVFGDTVNTAARIQDLTRDLNLPVLASRDVVQAAGATGWHLEAHTVLRGHSKDTDILRLEASDSEKWL